MNTFLNKMQYDVDKTAQDVVQLLLRGKIVLNTAESCTGGLLSSALTAVAGASEAFKLGIAAYDNLVKQKLLGVDGETLIKFGAVSAQCAAEMAIGARKASDGLFQGLETAGVSVTGIAGPGGGSALKPVGTVFFACCYKSRLNTLQLLINTDFVSDELKRQYIRLESVRQALILVKNTLQ